MCAELGDQSICFRAELPFREIQMDGLEAWAESSLMEISRGRCKALPLEELCAAVRAGDQQVLGEGDRHLPQSTGSAPGSAAWGAVVLPSCHGTLLAPLEHPGLWCVRIPSLSSVVFLFVNSVLNSF